MKTRRRTNFGSLESSCLLTKSGQLIPTLLFGASLFLAWLPSQINWFPVANLECSLCAMFFSPLPNTQIPSFFPPRNKSKATLPSSTQLCMCISFYTWKWFIFVSVPLMLRHVSYFIRHQQTAEKLLAWQASSSLTLKIHKPTDSHSLPLSLVLLFDFNLSWDAEVCFFFVVSTAEVMAGSKQTNLSDCRKIFKHTALHINKSRATWSWIPVTVSGEPLVFDEHYQRQMHSGWGKLRSQGEKKLQCRLPTKVRIILRTMNH